MWEDRAWEETTKATHSEKESVGEKQQRTEKQQKQQGKWRVDWWDRAGNPVSVQGTKMGGWTKDRNRVGDPWTKTEK
jgi:hypothetical protein